MRKWALFFIYSLNVLVLNAQKLKTDDGRKLNFSHFEQTTVLIFFNLECPICEKYTKVLTEFQQDSVFKNVEFYGILNDKTTDSQSINHYRQAFNFKVPFVFDFRKKLQKKLKAEVTPEVFVFNKNGEIIYRGAVDNWFYDFGKSRNKASEFYLLDALKAAEANQIPTISRTKAVGCYL